MPAKSASRPQQNVKAPHIIGALLPLRRFGRGAIAPQGERRTGCVGVAFELIFALLRIRLLHLDDAVGDRRTIRIPDHDVRTLRSITPEGNRDFDGETALGILVVTDEMFEPELADDF